MNIAIIGSGVAGLTSAYLLAPHHQVTIYEKADRIGGHAHTLRIKEGHDSIAVDNGFMVFNPKQYPNFIKLLGELQVKSRATSMTLGVSVPGELSYKGTLKGGIFAERSNIISPKLYKLVVEIIRFRAVAKKSLQNNTLAHQTLEQFLIENKFSSDLAHLHLYPMLSAIWSIKDTKIVGQFPTLATFTFLNNHQLLNLKQPKWRTIIGGSIKYVSKIETEINKHGTVIKLNQSISSITRHINYVSISSRGKTKKYDYVLFATHANTTLELLNDATNEEKAALGSFSYSVNNTVLHKDTRVVPKNKRLLAAWNYMQIPTKQRGNRLAVFTYCMNILQHIPAKNPVFVTLNPQVKIEKNKLYHSETYEHPHYNLKSIEGQQLIADLQAKNRTLYAGAYLGYGFHEDGVASAITAVSAIGILPPWNK